ncbi:GntR family transcriptional regulator [Acetivibrio clariflavus]|uniref:GntR family transcriptional regulator n=1 Tax=Acetivibrio clariflavus TaxID=288965 RepID=UPI00047F5770|nr:GntR family transcriptional regulator [Acetivibrio clariflavus]
MDIILSNMSDLPIYEQIYTQIKNSIISGEFKEGDMLPSIRTLAKDLRISVITTKRAYDELERDGYIYTVAGKGCYVAKKNMELIREEHLKKIEEYIVEIQRLAKVCNLSRDEIIEMFNIIQEEE